MLCSWKVGEQRFAVDARDISSQRKMRKPFVRQLAAAEISVIEVCNIGEKRVCNVAPRRNEAEGNLRRAAQSGHFAPRRCFHDASVLHFAKS
jgi:hypothetical protein